MFRSKIALIAMVTPTTERLDEVRVQFMIKKQHLAKDGFGAVFKSRL